MAPDRALLWLPALGVGIGPNVRFAQSLAAAGVTVAVLEWRGLGSSDRRASRRSDWGYRELLDDDIPAAARLAGAQLPDAAWCIGGHSLGGQLALLHAARNARDWSDCVLVGSGHPHWRTFRGWRGHALRLLLHAIAPTTALWGHFPGHHLRFAGREARRLMRDWARTARTGSYRVAPFDATLDADLRAWTGAVLGVRLADDRLAPAASLDHLRALAPHSDWTVRTLTSAQFAHRRADHFGWLREPGAVVDTVRAWLDTRAAVHRTQKR
nr:alpha/beta fold hydrolase [Chiayiivirga flava]